MLGFCQRKKRLTDIYFIQIFLNDLCPLLLFLPGAEAELSAGRISPLVFAWLQSCAGRTGGREEGESWYSYISPSLFSLFTPQSAVKLYIYCQTAETSAKGILTIKKLWGCEARLLHFNRKIFVTGRVVKWEEKWEVRECKYFPRQHWDLWEGMIFRTGPRDTPPVNGRNCPCQMFRLMEKF